MQISEKQILHFPEGLMGFEEQKQFALIEENEETPFKWLQSLMDEELAFIVVQPELFLTDYDPKLSFSDLQALGLSPENKGFLLLIITIPSDKPEDMTANLQGPILVNPQNHLAAQYISRDESHQVRYKILQEQESMEKV